MKARVLKLSGIFALCLVLFLALASCSVSKSYADKINEAADKKENITYEKVVKKLGEPQIILTAEVGSSGRTGTATWYKNYKSAEEANKAYEDGKTVKSITVTFAAGRAMSAQYTEAKKESK